MGNDSNLSVRSSLSSGGWNSSVTSPGSRGGTPGSRVRAQAQAQREAQAKAQLERKAQAKAQQDSSLNDSERSAGSTDNELRPSTGDSDGLNEQQRHIDSMSPTAIQASEVPGSAGPRRKAERQAQARLKEIQQIPVRAPRHDSGSDSDLEDQMGGEMEVSEETFSDGCPGTTPRGYVDRPVTAGFGADGESKADENATRSVDMTGRPGSGFVTKGEFDRPVDRPGSGFAIKGEFDRPVDAARGQGSAGFAVDAVEGEWATSYSSHETSGRPEGSAGASRQRFNLGNRNSAGSAGNRGQHKPAEANRGQWPMKKEDFDRPVDRPGSGFAIKGEFDRPVDEDRLEQAGAARQWRTDPNYETNMDGSGSGAAGTAATTRPLSGADHFDRRARSAAGQRGNAISPTDAEDRPPERGRAPHEALYLIGLY